MVDTVQQLAMTLNTLRPDLTKFLESQANVKDLRLRNLLLGQLQSARLVALRLAGK